MRRQPLTAVIVLSSVLVAAEARAEGVDGYIELSASRVNSENEDTSGNRLEQEVTTFVQRYNLTFGRKIFPNLEATVGGLYERESSDNTLLGVSFDSARKRVLPWATLTLRTQVFLAELAFDRRSERFDSALSTAKLTQETWRLSFGWFPKGLPRTRLELSHRNTFDMGRAGLDIVQDRAELTARHDLAKVGLYYRGSLERDRDRISDGEVQTDLQNLRISYGDTWRDRRFVLSTDYTVNYRNVETVRSGTGEVVFPIVPVEGLFALDDLPDRDPLAPNAALIDTNRSAPTGVDIGLPGLGADARPRNIGLDFGFPNEVNTIVVWVDRELPPGIAESFSWRVYTSADNDEWVLRQALASAPFGPFDNRFEVRFTAVTARYVKLVVSPLSPGTPDATSWPQIAVTELESQLRIPSADLTSGTSSTSQRWNFDFRARLLDRPALYYELAYFLSKVTHAPAMWTLSNGLSVSHEISPFLTGAARLSREDRQDRSGSYAAYLFSGSLTATPLPTFQDSLVVSYVKEEGVFGRETASAVLSAAAELYRGINGSASYGITVIRPNGGGRTESDDAGLAFTFVPHPKFTLNLAGIDRRLHTVYQNPAIPDRREDLRTAEIGAAYRPFRSLYLFASRRWEVNEQSKTRTLRNYAASWTPFPDGSFRLAIYYDSTYRTEFEETQETLVPSIRWTITPRIYLDLAYQDLRTTSLIGATHTKIGTATLRATF